MVAVEHAVNANAKFLKVEVQYFQQKKVILMQKKKMMVGDYHVKLQLKMI